ncbi:hypothetical protein BM86_17640 [Bacillus thuringiensis]|uniref:Uncharacterized protein n=1 Tax=Bacillus thuringiensis TaxID=1428 RepID=A0A9W3SJ53_BACTU|nr:hypothetical protein [Bacillus thuringiensis]ANS52164.1 hypothetical protein BT246_68730 [Bacillus thuringiensis]MBH0337246.1 hypothetical protein [Bacillus thuringiensis]
MGRLITSIKQTTKLFRVPQGIGEIMEYKERMYLIIGIENFKIIGHQLSIWYTVQDLENHNFISRQTTFMEHGLEECYVQYKYDDNFENIQLGRTFTCEGERYKILEYTDIVLKGTDIEVSFMATKVLPVDRKEVKMRYVAEKKKKLAIENV